MPTGYTADIAKGITFEQYALGCAKAFSALVMMRDDPADAPIPEAFKPNDYNSNALAEARKELARLTAMTDAECVDAERAEYSEHLQYLDDLAVKSRTLRRQYESMLAKVDAWEPPTRDHDKLKAFMRSQIMESMKFDCHDESYITKPVNRTGEQWRADHIAKARKDIAYHEKPDAEERARTESRNLWVKHLRESLK
jgi:hypothetical protein